ncbi:type IV secretory system conjugative DNA transfer family protein [Lacticaseibacillus sharpeae]|uniref:type IV secretory system conjugative DNA transfer family protein n=1 Tax=Lacticaseibacillus sharpeae TaxID=1626 RepID=UPI0009EC13FE|nr:type IV secretory system conjugative DNA transfer family protein [Lacticaseibacillus sharpeae]
MMGFVQFSRRVAHRLYKEEKPRESYEAPKKNKWRLLSDRRILIPVLVVFWLVIYGLLNYLGNVAASGALHGFLHRSLRGSSFKYNSFQLAFSPAFKPGLSIICMLVASAAVGATYLYVRAVFAPLEDEFVQGTNKFATEDELIKQYPVVTIHENAPFPALQSINEDVAGFPVHRFPQTAQEKLEGEFRLAVATELTHSVTVAHTRAGKEIYFIGPLIDLITSPMTQEKRHSFIYTATAGTEPRKWYKLLESRGYRVRVLNTVDPYRSDPYPLMDAFRSYYADFRKEQRLADKEREAGNEIAALEHTARADQWLDHSAREINSIATLLFPEKKGSNSDDFWVKAPRGLFKAMAYAVAEQSLNTAPEDPLIQAEKKEGFTLVNVYTIVNVTSKMLAERITPDYYDYLYNFVDLSGGAGADAGGGIKQLLAKYEGKTALDAYFGELPDGNPAKDQFINMMAGAKAEVTIANIVQNFINALDPFLRSGNAKMTAGTDDFHIDDLAFDMDQPTALFIMMSTTETENNQLGFLAIEQIYRRLDYRTYMSDDESFPRPLDLVADEVGNLGVIAGLSNKWTAALKRHFFIHLVLQSFGQMYENYGHDTAETIIGNAGIINYIRTGEVASNEYIGKRLGKRANYDVTRQKAVAGLHASNMEKMERIPLLDSFELSQLQEGESIIVRLMHTKDNEGKPIVPKPIRNSFLTDSNLIPIYKWRDMTTVGWDELDLNNSFLKVNMDNMRWMLYPIKTVEHVELPLRDQSETDRLEQKLGVERNTQLDDEQPLGELDLSKINVTDPKVDQAQKLIALFTEEELELNIQKVISDKKFQKLREKLVDGVGTNPELFGSLSTIENLSVHQIIEYVTDNFPGDGTNLLSKYLKAYKKEVNGSE